MKHNRIYLLCARASDSDEYSDIEMENMRDQSTRNPREAFQSQFYLKTAANMREKYLSMEKISLSQMNHI